MGEASLVDRLIPITLILDAFLLTSDLQLFQRTHICFDATIHATPCAKYLLLSLKDSILTLLSFAVLQLYREVRGCKTNGCGANALQIYGCTSSSFDVRSHVAHVSIWYYGDSLPILFSSLFAPLLAQNRFW